MKRTSPVRLPSLPLVASLCAAVLGSLALADVDVVVENGDAVQGTIDDGDASDTYRITCPAGATLKLKAKGKKGLQPLLDVDTPAAMTVAKGAESVNLDDLPMSGVYTVSVGGSGATQGDYALKLSVKAAKKLSDSVTVGEGEASYPFSVEAGTLLRAKLKAAKGSSAMPRLLRIEGPGDFLLDLSGPAKTPQVSLGPTELPFLGDYRLVFDDEGGTGGAVDVSLKLKPPKTARRKLDLRAKAIGDPGGERLAVANVIGSAGGSVGVALPGEGGPDSVIAGANVQVPAGALLDQVPMFVATSSPVQPLGDDGGAGPSVFFGPEGLSFQQDVAVTIPFDVAQFEGDYSSLVIYTRDARGKVSRVDGPYDVDADAGTCTFQVAHFSSFRAAKQGALRFLRDIVGAWKVPNDSPDVEISSYLIINDDGSAEVISDIPFQNRCIRSVVTEPGTPLELVFEVVDGRLRLINDPELQYERVSRKKVPRNCEEL